MKWARFGLAAALLTACKDDGGAEGTADESSTGEEPTSSSTTMPTTTSTTSTTNGCIPGDEDCVCSDGECVGEMHCVMDVCKPGPQFDPQDDEPTVLAGLYVPVQVEVNADEYSWSQVDGPATEILGEGASIQVPVPPDAAPGDVITLRIDATRNTIEESFEYRITVLEPLFEDFLVGISDTAELGTSVALDFDDNGNMWVSSSEGFLSRFGGDAQFLTSYDLAGGPAGLRIGRIYDPDTDDDLPALFVALTMEERVVAMNLNNEQVQEITAEIDGGMPLGPVDLVVPDDRDVYFSNGTQLLKWESDDAISRVLNDGAFTSPITALTLGPDANVLYVGTQGKVWRVGVQQDGTANPPELYLDIGDEADPLEAVAGIAFDDGGNMFVGVPGTRTLHLAPYTAAEATSIVRSFTAPGMGYDAFRSLRYGSDAFSRSALLWTNLTDRTVGRLETGLRGN